MASAQQQERTISEDIGLQRWNSREWAPIRHAVYRTLVDMTVFPALRRDGVPFPSALRQSAVEHDLIDATTSRPTDVLLWLNPYLRPQGVRR